MKLSLAAAAATSLILHASSVLAAPAAAFVQTTTDDFEEGEPAGTMVTPPGQVERGLKSTRVAVDAAFVWASVSSSDGKTLFVATGDPGRVYAVAVGGGGARLLAELPEPWVTAVAVEGPQSLLVATTPGAKIYRVGATDGKWKEIAHLHSEHVWALVHDREKRTTYAATGAPGRIAAIESGDKVRRVWDAGDQHVVALALAADGNLLAGSAEKAIAFRVSPQGQAFALNDFEAAEVRAVLPAGDATYLAVNAFEAEGEAAPAAREKGSARGTPLVTGGKSPAAAGRLPRPGAPKARGAVYRLDKNGGVEPLFSLDAGYFTSLAADKAGNVYAATGSDGKVYRIDAQRNVALVLDVPERQALTLAALPDGLAVGTGDAGGVFVARPASGKEATYLSRVFDAIRPAHWGHLRYGATAALSIETRSGNTARPDATWSSWAPIANPTFAQARGEGRIASVNGRYMQYRVLLPENGILRDATLFHRAQNLRPRAFDLVVAPTEAAATDKREHSFFARLRWKVDNADGDQLAFRLHYKPENEQLWRPLVPGDEALNKTEFDWNTETVPDGEYVVRVHVTDAPSVPQDQALESTYVSAPLLVDNTKPKVTALASKLLTVSGSIEDAASVIVHVEASVDGGAWHAVTAEDGLFDQKQEKFSYRLSALTRGDHVVAVRAFDAANNMAAAQIVVNVKEGSR